MSATRRSVLFFGFVAAITGTTGCALDARPSSSSGKVEIVASSSQRLIAIDHVTVTITGDGIGAPIVEDLAYTNGRWDGTISGVPSGSNRAVHADAFDATGATAYSGDVSAVTVSDGAAAVVAMVLQDAAPPPSFSNAAPVIDGVYASTNAVAPGGQVSLTVTASDPDGDAVTYAWSATDGTFDDPTSSQPTWTASSTNETVTITVTVTDPQGASGGMSFPVTVASSGSMAVLASFNAWPAVTAMSATATRIDPQGGATILTASASDADADPLTYVWTTDCDGTFAAPLSATTQFNLNTAPTSGACIFTFTASDGQGGSGEGMLQLAVASAPSLTVQPMIDGNFQSALQADGGQTITLGIQAHDPQNQSLSYWWTSDQGTIGARTDTTGSSRVEWVAPGAFTSVATITVYVSDDAGLTTSFQFTEWPSGVQCTTCSPLARAKVLARR